MPLTRPPILLCDSASRLDEEYRDSVVVCGSHGGAHACYLGLRFRVRAAIFSDAGVGLGKAGIAALAEGDRARMAVAAVDYRSARIGEAGDMLERGLISFVNDAATAVGCQPGLACRVAAAALTKARPPRLAVVPEGPNRTVMRPEGAPSEVALVDHNSLIEPADRTRVLVSGCHGGLAGGEPASALDLTPRAAIFHDAGIGIDEAGLARLAVLEERGVPAAAVDFMTARIGDARSVYETGRISRVNRLASALGWRVGMDVRDAVRKVAGS